MISRHKGVYKTSFVLAIFFHIIAFSVIFYNYTPEEKTSKKIVLKQGDVIDAKAVDIDEWEKRLKQKSEIKSKKLEAEKQKRLKEKKRKELKLKQEQKKKAEIKRKAHEKAVRDKKVAEAKKKQEKLKLEKQKIEKLKQEKLILAKKEAAEKKKKSELKRKKAEEKRKKAEEKKRLEKQKAEKKRKQAEKKRKAIEKKKTEELKQKKLAEEKKKQEKLRQEKVLADKLAKERQQDEIKQRLEAMEAEEEALLAEQAVRIKGIVNRYAKLIEKKITRYWRRPTNMAEKSKCTLSIRMTPDGDVISVKVVKSSGNYSFDRSAEKAVSGASPLPVPSDRHIFESDFRNLTINYEK